MRYPAYSEYKDSKIEWIEEIPVHWSVLRMRFICSITTGDKDTENREENGEYPFYVRADTVERISTYSYDGEAVLTAGDGVGVARVFHYANGKFDFHQRVYKFSDFEKVTGKFFFYYMRENLKKEVMKLSAKTTVDSLRMPMFQNFPFIIPTILEQGNITDFLDYKTQQIDQLIEKKKALIEKLNEQRIAVITQAVTKGLDKNSKMKPSGVDWLGDVPEHWDVKRLRFCIISNPVKSEIKDREGENLVSFVPMEAVKEYGGMDLSQTKMFEEVYNGYTYFKENDVVVAKITPCFENGKGSIAQGLENGIGFGTTEFHVLRGLETMDADYLFYLTISYSFRKNGEAVMLGAGGHKRIPEDYVKNYRQGIPGKEEQKEIVEYIQARLQHIDSMVSVSKQAIDKYEEYRVSIITAAVTGKIDVRNVDMPEEPS